MVYHPDPHYSTHPEHHSTPADRGSVRRAHSTGLIRAPGARLAAIPLLVDGITEHRNSSMFLAGAMLPSSGGNSLQPYRTLYAHVIDYGPESDYHARQYDPTGRAHRFTRVRRPQDLSVAGNGLLRHVSVELSRFCRVRPRQASHRGT